MHIGVTSSSLETKEVHTSSAISTKLSPCLDSHISSHLVFCLHTSWSTRHWTTSQHLSILTLRIGEFDHKWFRQPWITCHPWQRWQQTTWSGWCGLQSWGLKAQKGVESTSIFAHYISSIVSHLFSLHSFYPHFYGLKANSVTLIFFPFCFSFRHVACPVIGQGRSSRCYTVMTLTQSPRIEVKELASTHCDSYPFDQLSTVLSVAPQLWSLLGYYAQPPFCLKSPFRTIQFPFF